MRFLRAFLVFVAFTASGLAGITSFTANPVVFLPGEDVTLSWSVTAGDVISIAPGVGPITGATGSVIVQPTVATTYTLTDTTSGTSSQVVVAPFAPQLVSRWTMNEGSGTAVNDSVGTAHGIIRGTTFTRTATTVSLPGGSSATAPYIDLPNGLISTKNEVTIEGWMTIAGSQTWSRYFDFGTGSGGEINAPGGSFTGTEYLTLTAQIGTNQAQRRLAIRDNNLEQTADLADTTTNGTPFHFAVVYDADGNAGQPQLRYYKNGTLVGSLNTSYRLQNIVDVNNWLGRSNFSADNNTQGSYNEVRLWDTALTATAIAGEAASADPDANFTQPVVHAFTLLPATTIFRGQTARLSYVFGSLDGSAVTGSIDQGVGALPGASGFVSVTPLANTTYTLTVTGPGGTRTAQTTVTVLPGDPVAHNQSVTVPYDTATPITLVATDPNTPVDSLTFTIVSAPGNGALTGSGATRTYTPAAGYFGTDSFTFKANDGLTDSNVATVSITVNPPPVAPVDLALSNTALYTEYGSGSFAGLFTATDGNPDDTFTYALVGGAGSTNNSYFTIVGNQLIASHDFSNDLGQVISIRVQVTDSTGNTFEKVLTFPVQARPRHVQINEINYNGARNTLRTEYIELYNPLTTAVDLSNWRLAKAVEYIFPAGASIPAGGYLVIAEDPPTMTNLYGVTAVGPWTNNLSSEGDDVQLRNAAGDTVDRVQFGVTAPWPATPNGGGPSLELVNPNLDSDLGGNWRSSTVAATAASYVTANSSWSYRKGTSEASSPIAAWRAIDFVQDASWLTGTAPIGLFKKNSNTAIATLGEVGVTLATQLTDMATLSGSTFTTSYRCVYFRKTFNVAGPIPRSLLLRVMHNDAAVVWINGTEVARFGFPQGSPNDPPFNYTAYYERGNDPWSELVLANPSSYLTVGDNVITIQGFAKPPQTRSDQEDFASYNIFDFSIDAELKNTPELAGTPGAQNSVFSTTNPPAVRDIKHVPVQPKSTESITVSARISDPQGVGSVTLSYQVNAPGAYIPSTLPLTVSQILANPLQALPPNPAFEAVASWTTVPMVDDGTIAGDIPGDGVFTGRIPAQPHRTLVRYRITAQDLGGQQVRVPAVDDPRKNFTVYVYNGVPFYTGGGKNFGPGVLDTLPVYQWLTRASDFSTLLAYSGADQFANTIDLNVLLGRRFENVVGTLVVGDQVIDHVRIRLRGGNSRYAGSGKRHFRFIFPKGTPLYAMDETNTPYRVPWEDMLFNKMFGNKGYYDWGLPYETGAKLWNLVGIPMPESHWVHFRVVRNSNESDATQGDFWGLYHALEFPDGKNFLDARDLPKGNFYKMSDWTQNGEMAERYETAGGAPFGDDFDNIRYNIHQTASETFLKTYVNIPLWYRYNALQEAMRHYDIFVEPTGRHRVKNLIWWFEPQAGNPLGRCLFMPYDWDATFGPTFNNGWDFVHNALYNHIDIPDSPTWQLPKQNRAPLQIEHRNAIRELRDLIWYRDTNGRGPFDDIVDDAFARISAFWPADRARWPITGAVADNPGGAPFKVQDMKNFAFVGWTDTVGGDPAIGAGGRAAFLDAISDNVDSGQLPAKPVITYGGAAGYPVDGVALTSSAFSDPQGDATISAMQWRIGEVTDPTAPAYNPLAPRIYEATPIWESGELPAFNASITVPGTVMFTGHTYRARVRHKDNTGRWGHWSAPLQFTTTASNYAQVLRDNLMVAELMYHPAAPTSGYVESDFEYIELQNISSSLTLDLSNVRFTKGVDFNFAGSAITSLDPGARVLVVRNAAAFNSRYGAGKPIAGEWVAGDSLSNSGEEMKLSYGAGNAIQDFTYSDSSPWPTQADAGGYSLTLKSPASRPDHNIATNWRAGYVFNGTPGTSDVTDYATWASANGVSDLLADGEGDNIVNLLEYAFGGSPTAPSRSVLPTGGIQSFNVGGTPANYLTLTFNRALGAEDISYTVQWSSNLATWTAGGALVGSVDHGDGTTTETWRAPSPTSVGRYYGRVLVTKP
jgi:hypothetical protein